MSGYCDIVSDVMSICKIVDVVFRNDILLYDVKSETAPCNTPVFEQLLLSQTFFYDVRGTTTHYKTLIFEP